MPRINTECTELSVAFGLLKRNPETAELHELPGLFEGSLSVEKFNSFLTEYRREPSKYAAFHRIGERLRDSYSDMSRVASVRWSGPEQQAATISVARDLTAASIPISVKDDSNVTHNMSPYNLFVGLPGGRPPATGEVNWFINCDYEGMQALYRCVRDQTALDLPEDVRDFEEQAPRQQRRVLQGRIAGLQGSALQEFTRLYVAMCRQVSHASADRFNQNLSTSLQSSGKQSVLESIIKGFFRVNAVPYVLVGFDRRNEFAVRIPDITEWKQQWRVVGVEASPAPNRRQSVVYLIVRVAERRGRGRVHDLRFHVEIRWSHGKFCGNPEAKLYKEFGWVEVPFFQVLF